MFGSSGKELPRFLPEELFASFPYAAFSCLLAEDLIAVDWITALEYYLLRNPAAKLEEAIKKVQKSHKPVPVIMALRWLTFVCSLNCGEPILPLILQRLFLYLLRRINSGDR